MQLMKILLMFFFLLYHVCIQAQQETIFYNARIFTANPSRPFAEAVGIRGEMIAAVGKLSEVKQVMGPGAVLTDLHGAFLMPGMVDAHNHAIRGGQTLSKPNQLPGTQI